MRKMVDRTAKSIKQNVSRCPFVSKMDELFLAVNHKINIFYIHYFLFLLINPFAQMPNLAKTHPFFSLYNSRYEHHRDLNNGLNEAGHLYHLRYQLYLYLNYVNKLN